MSKGFQEGSNPHTPRDFLDKDVRFNRANQRSMGYSLADYRIAHEGAAERTFVPPGRYTFECDPCKKVAKRRKQQDEMARRPNVVLH